MPVAPVKPAVTRSIFVSYAHKDYGDVVELLKWIEPLCRRLPGVTSTWIDYEQLKGGDEWNDSILGAIDRASIFLVVMSIDYVDSDYCRAEELSRILAKRERGEALVVGIALRPTKLEDFTCTDAQGRTLALSRLQCLPLSAERVDRSDGYGLKPISLWPAARRDLAWLAVVEQLEAALQGRAAVSADLHQPPAADASAGPTTDRATRNTSTRPAVGLLLPYLADRQPQSYDLAMALQRWEAGAFARPLVVLTDGRPEDCLSKWVDRMHQHEFDEALGIERDGLAFGHFKAMLWPTRPLAQPADARRHFEVAMADAIGPRRVSPIGEVMAAYLTRARPTLLSAQCGGGAMPEQALAALDGLIDLLAAWPGLSRHTMLVLAINIERPATSPADVPSPLTGPFTDRLKAAESAGHLTFATLDPLPELGADDIERWAQDRCSARLHQSIEDLIAEHLPQDRSRWSMREFATIARKWLVSDASAS